MPRALMDVSPHEQFKPWTSATMVEIAAALSEHHGIEISPIKAEAVVRGYLGLIGSDILMGVDMLVEAQSPLKRPTPRLDEVAVIGAFTTSQPFRRTSYEEAYYEMAAEARMLASTVSKVLREGRDPTKELDEPRERMLFGIAAVASRVQEDLSKISQSINIISFDRSLDAIRKRTLIDSLQGAKNEILYKFAAGLPEETRREFGFPSIKGLPGEPR